MALNWNIGQCQDKEGIREKREWPITETLIFATIIVGMNEITEKNWREFYTRISYYEGVRGAFLSDSENGKAKARPIKPEDVKRRIGLGTNASNLTETKFMKQVWTIHKRETEAMFARRDREEEKANGTGTGKV